MTIIDLTDIDEMDNATIGVCEREQRPVGQPPRDSGRGVRRDLLFQLCQRLSGDPGRTSVPDVGLI